MTVMHALVTGIFFAFGLILPLGPQNAFVLSQGMNNKKWRNSLVVAVTASLCDTVLILASIVGLSLVIFRFGWIREIILVLGFFFLVYLGKIFWNKPITQQSGGNGTADLAWWQLVGVTMLFSLLNPYALIDTMVTIGTMSLSYQGLSRYWFAAGCVLTSWAWFFFLLYIGKHLERVDWVRRYEGKIAGVIIWAASISLLYQLVISL